MIAPILKPRQFRFTGEDYDYLLNMMRKANTAHEEGGYANSYKHTISFNVTLYGAWVQDATMSGVADVIYDSVVFTDSTITPNE